MDKATQKKKQQLGMNPSTARSRLVKDILFQFVEQAREPCFRCGKPLTKDTLTIEHKEAWLDSDDPVGLYFNLNNIAFSHYSCNSSSSRPGGGRPKAPPRSHGVQKYWKEGCRCDVCKLARHSHYKRTGY